MMYSNLQGQANHVITLQKEDAEEVESEGSQVQEQSELCLSFWAKSVARLWQRAYLACSAP